MKLTQSLTQLVLRIDFHKHFFNWINHFLILLFNFLNQLFIILSFQLHAIVKNYLILWLRLNFMQLIILSLTIYFFFKFDAFILIIQSYQQPLNLFLYPYLYKYPILIEPIQIYFNSHLFILLIFLDFLQIMLI